MLENRMTLDFIEYHANSDETDRRMEALAQREDEEYENSLEEDY